MTGSLRKQLKDNRVSSGLQSEGVQSIMVEGVRRQKESEAAGYIVSTVGKETGESWS